MQPANATESDARLALYLCVDIFLIFSYFPIFHRLRFPFHDDGRVSLLLLFQFTLGAAQLKLLFINLATFTHSLKDCVACKRDFCFQFSVFFLLDHSESGREENHVRLGALSKENCLAAVKIFLCRDFPSHRIAWKAEWRKISGALALSMRVFSASERFDRRWSSRRFCRLSSVDDRICKLQSRNK